MSSSFATGAVHVTFSSNVNSATTPGNMDVFSAGTWWTVTAWNASGTTLNITAAGAGVISTVTAVRTTGQLAVVFANGIGNDFPQQIPSS